MQKKGMPVGKFRAFSARGELTPNVWSLVSDPVQADVDNDIISHIKTVMSLGRFVVMSASAKPSIPVQSGGILRPEAGFVRRACW